MAEDSVSKREQALADRAIGWGFVLYKSSLNPTSPLPYQLQTEPGLSLGQVADYLDQLDRGGQPIGSPDEAIKAAQRARQRGDDAETVADIERDTRDVLRARRQGNAVSADVLAARRAVDRVEALGYRVFVLANGGFIVTERGVDRPEVLFIHEHDDSGFEEWLARVERGARRDRLR